MPGPRMVSSEASNADRIKATIITPSIPSTAATSAGGGSPGAGTSDRPAITGRAGQFSSS